MDGLPPAGLPDVDAAVGSFFDALTKAGFSGETASDPASRIACSTDNSIYQIFPQGVAYPHDGNDLTLLMQVARRKEFQGLKIYPRGGGTSTNGQSLGPGLVVDTSRHMRRILAFDADTGLVTVEPGLVRDRLIEFLKPHGRFFAPHVSTTNRATLGGMTSNDSSGKGSLVYGKTSDHIEAIAFILPDGEPVAFGRVAKRDVPRLTGAAGAIARKVDGILAPHAEKIAERFPDLKRGFTGYNLKEARSENGDLNLAKLVAGSEGTLGLIKSITLRTLPLPQHTVLAVLVYPGHDTGLRAVPELLQSRPHAIEFIDDKVLDAALRSPFADDVRDVLGIQVSDGSLAALFVEMSDDDAGVLEQRLQTLLERLKVLPDESSRPVGVRVVRDTDQIARVWEIRRACQGLIAGFDQNRRAVAFIEDCAVPPENLADFVGELKATLNARNIALSMFGHADVGCVHIRPLMNLTAEDERRQIREITDAVFALTRKYGGLLWGEHGKGLRGEYSERVIGDDLFRVMRQVKSAFDPLNRMNPGKIARPEDDGSPLIALDDVHMRGAFDEQISPALSGSYPAMLRCDGNGACFNQDDTLPFCPSYKATGDRRLSPKGRAGVLREWARARSLGDEAEAQAMAAELHEVLDTCLACKACAGAGCPARADIPQMKSQFLDWFYTTRRRPLADHLVANLERATPIVERLGGGVFNILSSTGPARQLASRGFGLVDLPAIRNRRDYLRSKQALDVRTLPVARLLQLPQENRDRTVVIVQDCFTSFYDVGVLLAHIELVQKLGFVPVLLSYSEGGKPLHVKGFLDRFKQVAAKNARDLAALQRAGFTLLGVDGATTLMYRHEYAETLPDCPEFTVLLLSEWLQNVDLPTLNSDKAFTLIQHCTERSLTPEASAQWTDIFRRTGINMRIVRTGCCGMSGLFGHETSHQEISTKLYDQNWRGFAESKPAGSVVASGYSCRSQVKRLSGIQVPHPAQVILNHWPADVSGAGMQGMPRA